MSGPLCTRLDATVSSAGSGRAAGLPVGRQPGDVLVLFAQSYRLFGDLTLNAPAGWTDLGGVTGRASRMSCRTLDGSETDPVIWTGDGSDWDFWNLIWLRQPTSTTPLFPYASSGDTIPGITVPTATSRAVVLLFAGSRVPFGDGNVTSAEGYCRIAHAAGNFYTPGVDTFAPCFPAGPTGDFHFSAVSAMEGNGRVAFLHRAGCYTNAALPLRQVQRDTIRARQLGSQQRSGRAGWPNAYL